MRSGISTCLVLVASCALCVAADDNPEKQPPTRVRCLAFSPDGRLLAAAGSQGTVAGNLIVWDTGSFHPRWQLNEKNGFAQVAFSPDGKLLALSRFAPETKLFDARSGQLIRELEGHTEHACCVTFTPDGKRIITGSYDRTVRIWETSTGKTLLTLEGYGKPLHSVAVSPNGTLLAIAAAREGKGKVHLWDLKNSIQLQVFNHLGSHVSDVSFSPDGKLLAISSWTEDLTLYDTSTFDLRMCLEPGGGVRWAEFSPDQQWLAVVTNTSKIHVFPCNTNTDETTRQRVERLLARFEDDSYAVREQAMGDLETIGSAAAVQLRKAMKSTSAEVRWRARKLHRRLGQPESAIQLDGHYDDFDCVTFSPDSKLMAAGDKGGSIFVWSIGDWKVVARLSLGTAAR